jgi:hypothetical protein
MSLNIRGTETVRAVYRYIFLVVKINEMQHNLQFDL